MSNIPENLKYTAEHEWVKIDGDIATIGITDFAQSELGDIVFVELPDIGTHLEGNSTFGTIEAIKAVADLFAPLSGEVTEINESLEDEPEQINQDAYEGWILKMKISDVSEVDNLLSSDKYSEIVAS
ncbi:MAG: glycine cleavage system protein GcvH [Calditrichaeota bacterium]|nr:MAG: glycine cleavage system protein GcvH [Calditrichota bacterium]